MTHPYPCMVRQAGTDDRPDDPRPLLAPEVGRRLAEALGAMAEAVKTIEPALRRAFGAIQITSLAEGVEAFGRHRARCTRMTTAYHRRHVRNRRRRSR